ncbi:hypothetical protein I3842_14G123100 [Carya illinoinensis]|uniref:Uncharacterized protein n=1 Tax=Carya illinoinensis TaxID=32201 RepID=A0A922AI34_CARIL|nr:hypothetical protein I3842_14G123100 [Carya illinoinensis]
MMRPSSSTNSIGNFLSMVLASTVVIQGAAFVMLIELGPPLPAEAEKIIPFSIAPKDAIAITSSWYGMGSPPKEDDIMSTPSSTVASMPARTSEWVRPESKIYGLG